MVNTLILILIVTEVGLFGNSQKVIFGQETTAVSIIHPVPPGYIIISNPVELRYYREVLNLGLWFIKGNHLFGMAVVYNYKPSVFGCDVFAGYLSKRFSIQLGHRFFAKRFYHKSVYLEFGYTLLENNKFNINWKGRITEDFTRANVSNFESDLIFYQKLHRFISLYTFISGNCSVYNGFNKYYIGKGVRFGVGIHLGSIIPLKLTSVSKTGSIMF